MKHIKRIIRVLVVLCSLHTMFWLSLATRNVHGSEYVNQQKGSNEQVGASVTVETAPVEIFWQVATATGTASDIPTGPRYRAAGTSCDGKTFYVIGGVGAGGLLKEAWRYKPADKTWTRLADLPVPLMNFEAACIDGVIYLVGGYDMISHTNNFQLYDIATDGWTATTWPNTRTPMTAVYNGKLYAFGGNPGPSNETWVYDPYTHSWQRLADMPTAVAYGAAITVENHIYQIGGGQANTVQRYDPKSNTWDNSGPQLQDSRMSALTAWYGKYIYVVSGGGSGGDLWTGWPTIEKYDYSKWPAGSWSYDDDVVSTPFVAAAGDCTAEAIWGAGGTSGGMYLATNQYFEDGIRCHFPYPWHMFLPGITTGEAVPKQLIPDTVTGLWEVYFTPDETSIESSPSIFDLYEQNGAITGNKWCDPDPPTVSGNINGKEVIIYLTYFRAGLRLLGTINGLQMNGTYNDDPYPDTGTWRAIKIINALCE